jgi:hypothetical protein
MVNDNLCDKFYKDWFEYPESCPKFIKLNAQSYIYGKNYYQCVDCSCTYIKSPKEILDKGCRGCKKKWLLERLTVRAINNVEPNVYINPQFSTDKCRSSYYKARLRLDFALFYKVPFPSKPWALIECVEPWHDYIKDEKHYEDNLIKLNYAISECIPIIYIKPDSKHDTVRQNIYDLFEKVKRQLQFDFDLIKKINMCEEDEMKKKLYYEYFYSKFPFKEP